MVSIVFLFSYQYIVEQNKKKTIDTNFQIYLDIILTTNTKNINK